MQTLFKQTLSQWREFAKQLKQKVVVAVVLLRRPDVPLYAKLLLAIAVAYVMSPIDLIPDFIPVLGALDDLIIAPALIWLAFRLVPKPVLLEAEVQAANLIISSKRAMSWGALIILSIWAGLLYWAYRAWFAQAA